MSLGGSVERYCSSEDDQTINGVVYTAAPILRNAIKLSDLENNAIEVQVPSSTPFVRSYIANVPGQEAQVTISRIQRPDSVTQEVVTLFQGYVASLQFLEKGQTAKILVNPLRKRAARMAPRCKFSGTCNNVLGDEHCKVNLTSSQYRAAAVEITAINGNEITVAGVNLFGDGFFDGGHVSDLASTEGRMVISHTGNTLQITLPFPPDVVTVGTLVNVTAGCGHTVADCQDKFNNLINYGGFAFVPDRNPFDGSIEPRNC